MSSAKRIAIYYHKKDLDGVMSGVIARHYLAARRDPSMIDMIGIDYGQDFIGALPRPGDEYETIYVLDVCDRALFEAFGKKIVWIDHHINAQKGDGRMPRVRDCFFVDGVAACRLVFDYMTFGPDYVLHGKSHFFDRKNPDEPWIVALAGEFDIWDKTSPLAERFNFGCTELTPEFVEFLFLSTKKIKVPAMKSWDICHLEENKLVSDADRDYSFIKHITTKGEGVLAFIKNVEERIKPIDIVINGYKGKAYNTHIKSSLIAKPDGEDFLMVWSLNEGSGGDAEVSFYGGRNPNIELNVGKLAAKFGGGGHVNAAGCRMTQPDLMNILKGLKTKF